MISIDRISFEFAMNDEPFAHSLYAEWDNFCRTCFENIVEECLSAYDKHKMLHEIEKLDLDLGSIPQEKFYSEFPVRLREELLKALPSLQFGQANMEEEETVNSRFANLLYYLEHGVLKTEWADVGFNLSKELTWLMKQDKRYMEKIAELCIANEHALRRLLLQTDNNAPLVLLYSIAMDQTFSVKNEKQRFMEIFLEMQPDMPVHFVHATTKDEPLHSMAELLDSRSVHKIMEKEVEKHAEVDLPPYWHYLYEYLIKYYPYNGVAIFGDKSYFISHLHYRLLTFIRKRNNTLYLSKAELTVAFLLEVFGTAYYKEVLNAIYNMHPRNADSSPAYDGYYNCQLYRVLMQLSLLYSPMSIDANADETGYKENTSSLLTDFRMKDLCSILKDVGRSEADKRMLIGILVQKTPEAFISWIKTETTNDSNLKTILAEVIDEITLKQLVASISLIAMEIVDEVIRHLTNLVREKKLSDGLPYESFTLTVRKAVLLWIKDNGYALSVNEGAKSLLQLIHKETTGKDNESTMKEWAEEVHLFKNEDKDFRIFIEQNDNEIKESIRRLRVLLTAENIAKAVKRRLVVYFLEQHKDRYADAILELHEEELLEDAINLVSFFAIESVIRQMVVRHIGTDKAEKLLLLMGKLFANENSVSAYLKDKSLTLRTQVFIWLAKETKVQDGTVKSFIELFFLFLTFLFGKENVSVVVRLVVYGMTGELTTGEVKGYDILEVIHLVSNTDSSRVRHEISVFEQWSQNIKEYSNTVQMLLQSRWNTSGSFMEWLKNTEMATESKRDILQTLAREKPQELVRILRNLSQSEETVPLMVAHIPTEVLLDVVEKIDAKQALLLSQTIDLLQREPGRFVFLINMTIPFTTALSEALLLFMQDNDTLGGRNLTEQEVVEKFLSHLYYVYTRKTNYNDHEEWKYLQDEVTNGLGLNSKEMASISEDTIYKILQSEYDNLDNSKVYHLMVNVLNKQPKLFIELSEKNIDTNFIRRISSIVDKRMLNRIVTVLSSVSEFENHTAFMRLIEWLSIRIPVSDIVSVLLSWINTTDWKRQTIRQMTLFFILRLCGSDDTTNLPLEMLTDDTLPEELRKQLLRNYMRSRPADLLSYIQQLAAQGKLPMDKWAEWADISEWLWLSASMSLTLEELLRQVIEYLLYQNKLIDETVLRYGLAKFIATNNAARFTYYVDKTEVVRSFFLSFPTTVITKIKKEEMMNEMMENLGITPEEERIFERSQEGDSEIAVIGNAGLCLLSPWLPRLFTILGYLEKRNFRDTESRVRAVFLLQYLVYLEEKDYHESELVFNRLLVALPAYIPLPKRIGLTDEEKQTTNDMLESVKANWSKMNGTSVSGFIQSFIARNGRLEQQDEKWLLTVETRPYDILLEYTPWAFRQIRFPWLKKHVQVFWNEKQTF